MIQANKFKKSRTFSDNFKTELKAVNDSLLRKKAAEEQAESDYKGSQADLVNKLNAARKATATAISDSLAEKKAQQQETLRAGLPSLGTAIVDGTAKIQSGLSIPKVSAPVVEKSDFDLGQFTADTIQTGIQQVAKSGSSALAFAEGLITRPIDYLLTGGESTPLTDSGVFNRLNKDIDREMQTTANRAAANIQAGGKAAEVVHGLGAATVAAIPQALTALATAGGSVAVKGLQVAQAAPGVMASIQTVASQTAKNPMFWTSFFQTVGTEYEEAKARGASEVAATLEALTAGSLSAAVEIGGGLEKLPDELLGDSFTVRKWIETMVDEGREEVVQGVLSRGFQTLAAGDNAPLFSTTDPKAVFNPVTAAQEFAGGAVVGGILGGAQGVAANIMNSVRKFGDQPTVDNPASPVYNNTDKTTQQAVEKAQTAELGEPVVAKTATVLDTGTTAYVQLGMKPKRAEAKAKVVQKLINGEEVSLDGMKSLNLTDAKYREVFTQLTGVVFPEGMANHDQLMNVAKTASEVRNNVVVEEAPIVPMAEPVIAQDTAQPVAQVSDEVGEIAERKDPGTGIADLPYFAQVYRETVNPDATEAEIQQSYEGYLAQARGMEFVTLKDGTQVNRTQFISYMKQANPGQFTDEQLNEFFNYALQRESGGGEAMFRMAEPGTEHGGLSAYKSSESYKVNAALRESGGVVPEEFTDLVNNLDADLADLPDYTGTVYRSIAFDLSDRETIGRFIAEHEPGQIVTQHAYTSTSKAADAYEADGDLVVNMTIIGATGKDVSKLYGLREEQEVLIGRGAQFRIEDVRFVGKNAYITMTEVNNELGQDDQRGKGSVLEGVSGDRKTSTPFSEQSGRLEAQSRVGNESEQVDGRPDQELTDLEKMQQMPWSEQIDHLEDLPEGTALYIRDTPYLLSEIGLGDLPMCMTVNHAVANMAEQDDSDQHNHGVSKDVMQRLPELLSAPVMVLKSNSKYDSIVVVLNEVDGNNDPIMVAIKSNGKATVGGVKGPANFILSVYPRSNFAVRPGENSKNNYMYLATRGDRRQVLYWNKARSEELFDKANLKLPRAFVTGAIKPDEIIKPFRGYDKSKTPERMFSMSEEEVENGSQRIEGSNRRVSEEPDSRAARSADRKAQADGETLGGRTSLRPYQLGDQREVNTDTTGAMDAEKQTVAPFTFHTWFAANDGLNPDSHPLYFGEFYPGIEEMELGYIDRGWHTVASYPATKSGLEQFNREGPALMEQYRSGKLDSSATVEKTYDGVSYTVLANPELVYPEAVAKASRVGATLNVVTGHGYVSKSDGRLVAGFAVDTTGEIFAEDNPESVAHEVMHEYLYADHGLHDKLVNGMAAKTRAAAWDEALNRADEVWGNALRERYAGEDPLMAQFYLDYALANEVLCEAQAGSRRLGSCMNKLIPYVQKQTEKWEKEWDAKPHNKIVRQASPSAEELITFLASQGEEAEISDEYSDFHESYLPSPETDSEGRTLSVTQSKYFANSRMRDRAGNLKLMYHGTDQFGFTVFDPKKSDGVFFFSDNPETARSYSGTRAVRSAMDEQKAMPDWLSMSDDELVDAFNEGGNGSRDVHLYYPDEARKLVDDYNRKLQNTWTSAKLAKLVENIAFSERGEAEAAQMRDVLAGLLQCYENFFNAESDDAKLFAISEMWDFYSDNTQILTNHTFARNVFAAGLSAYQTAQAMEFVVEAEATMARGDGSLMRVPNSTRIYTREALIDELIIAYSGEAGNMPVYLNAENPLLIASDGAVWYNIPLPEELAAEFDSIYGQDSHTTRNIAEFARSKGYDSVIIYDLMDNGGYATNNDEEATIAIMFEPEQIKDAYNLDPTKNPDIRYSMSEAEEEREFRERYDSIYGKGAFADMKAAARKSFVNASKDMPKAPASQSDDDLIGWVIRGKNNGAAALGFDPYTYLTNEYGAIEQTGKNNFRVADVPKRTNPKDKVSKTTTTIMGAKATPEKRLATIAEAVVDGDMSYLPTTNKVKENKARARIRRIGYQAALTDWTSAVRNGKSNADMVAMGATLLNNAGNSDMDGKAYVRLMSDYAQLLRNAGQALQAANIFKKMSPEAKLYEVMRTVDKINADRFPDANVPVEKWMDRVGGQLADKLTKLVNGKHKSKVDTVCDTILKDLYQYARKLAQTESPLGMATERTEMKRLEDMLQNIENYQEAWLAAKQTIQSEFGDDPKVMAALEDWLKSELSLAKPLTKELTGQTEIIVDELLAEQYLRAETEEEREFAYELILQNIADQMPATLGDKFRAWRYTAMLGNLRTGARNFGGNVLMMPTRMLKETFAGLTEALVKNHLTERTTSVKRDPETLKAAKGDFQKVKDIIAAGGKYQDYEANVASEILDRQRIFKTAVLEGYRKSTKWMMEDSVFGDNVFSSFAYRDALARYIAANGTTWSQASEELKDKARAKAVREAAEATYRDNNAISNLVVGLRADDKSFAGKAANAILEGVLPFRKTPANVLVRTVEYSPLGLLSTAFKAVQAAKGDAVTGNDIVNALAKNITGTSLLAVGYGLGYFGLLQGAAPDDEKEKEMWEMQGHQAYSIEIGGTSYTIDWAAPLSIPLLVGAELQEAMMSEGVSLREGLGMLGSIFDPVLEMSMLQGINDAISDAQTYGDESALVRLVGNALWSYTTQVVPTIAGQFERASQNQRISTYTDKNKDIPDGIQRALGRVSAKIPGLDYAQTVYMDAWGRTQANASSTTLNIIEQFLSPGYANAIVESDMEKELLRLKQATGESGVLIASAPKYFNVDKVRKDLTAPEYLTYAKTRGQTAYSLLTEMTAGTTYNGMPDGEKVYAVERAYDYANQIAKELVTGGKYAVDKWVGEARTLEAEYGVDVTTYLTAYASTKDMTSLKDKGETVDNSLALKKANYILSIPGLTDEQRVALADTLGCNQTVLGWLKRNPKIIPKKLEAMEKKYG